MPRYTNPVFHDYFADPFVWRVGRTYLAIGTGPAEAAGVVPFAHAPSVFPLLRSPDLVHWERAGHALMRPDAELGDTYWAPEIATDGDRWYLYYSVGFADTRHHLRVATSARPDGPYLDEAALTRPDEVPFAIDPHPFRDADGRWYLFHARDFLDAEPAGPGALRAGTALVVHPMESMTAMAREGRTVLRARCDWQRFAADRAMYGGTYDWHTLEGPFVVHHQGRYYCLYSGGCWQDATYGVDHAVAEHVLGPYDAPTDLAGPRVLRTVPGRVLGPGHCSVVLAPDDATAVCVYHAWDPGRTARRMCIDRMIIDADGPRVLGPTWTEHVLPGGPA